MNADAPSSPEPADPPPAVLLDPQRQFLGCLIQQPAQPARRLLAGLEPDDFTDPMCGWALQLAAQVCAAGQDPTPMALLDLAQETITTAPRSGGADRLARLGLWLVEIYHDSTHHSAQHGAWLKTLVLKHAWRRAVTDHATRVLQAAGQGATSQLRRIHTDTQRVDQLWRRYQAATEPDHHAGTTPITGSPARDPVRRRRGGRDWRPRLGLPHRRQARVGGQRVGTVDGPTQPGRHHGDVRAPQPQRAASRTQLQHHLPGPRLRVERRDP